MQRAQHSRSQAARGAHLTDWGRPCKSCETPMWAENGNAKTCGWCRKDEAAGEVFECADCACEFIAKGRRTYCDSCSESRANRVVGASYERPCCICRKTVVSKQARSGPNTALCGNHCKRLAKTLSAGVRCCQWCSAIFWPSSAKVRFCSSQCSNAKRAGTFHDEVCNDCGVVFHISEMGAQLQHGHLCGICSAGSERQAEQRRVRHAMRALREWDTDDLVEAHGTVCHLCLTDIDISLSWPDRRSLSADHLVPISLDGEDTLDNVRPSHLRCNTIRGNRPADCMSPTVYASRLTEAAKTALKP